ncbi:MAG: hypothetical protein DHS20C16_06530 [Phycisphaerae bacterium]|nr:MAG: hypothetical protein DHS20C16_06530 [Phycisphaerae bacterium]
MNEISGTQLNATSDWKSRYAIEKHAKKRAIEFSTTPVGQQVLDGIVGQDRRTMWARLCHCTISIRNRNKLGKGVDRRPLPLTWVTASVQAFVYLVADKTHFNGEASDLFKVFERVDWMALDFPKLVGSERSMR